MNYEKAYKEALERAREFQKSKDGLCVLTAESIFPELQESEDEKIRKGIIDFLWKEKIFLQEAHSSVENNPKYRFVMDAIAWLEKQGERPSAIRWYDVSLIPKEMEELLVEWDSEDATWHEIAFYHADTKTFWDGTSQVENVTRWCYIIDLLEKQGKKKATDKVEPKFHEGDWIIDKQGIVHQIEKVIENVTNNTFGYDLVGGGYFNEEVKSCRLWTIQDAKDGDVLACENGWTCIFNCLHDNLFNSHCFMDGEGWFCEDGGEAHTLDNRICGEIYPATKEQRDLLFKKIKEAGYEWDAEKKELKLLISNGGDFESNNSKQKPTWSDEDKMMLNELIIGFYGYRDQYPNFWKLRTDEIIEWLKKKKDECTTDNRRFSF